MQLIDNYNRKHSYLRISVTDRCNLRCFYCLPKDEDIIWKPKNKLLTFEEIEKLSRIFVSLGTDKIRITGGEPLVRNGLPELLNSLGKLKSSGLKTLAMTTNGLLLARHAQAIRESGVTHLNVSLDSLKQKRFEKITGRDQLTDVISGVEAAVRFGFPSIKLNVVVIAGVNDDEVLDMIEYANKLAQNNSAINVRFIEFMPFVGNGWNIEKVIPYSQILNEIESKYKVTPLKTEPSAVAKDFAVDGYDTSVSFITSMTESFCSTCNRLRLTADGSIKPCLFDPSEISLRDLLRNNTSEEVIIQTILDALKLKPEAHEPAEDLAADYNNRSMIQIGG